MTPPASGGGIRLAVATDAAAIAALETELFPGTAWSEAQVVEELTGYGRRGWLWCRQVRQSTADAGHVTGRTATIQALDDGTAVLVDGYVLMRTVGDVSDLQRIGVAPSRQRSGLAAALLAAARAGVREEGAERILLEVAEDNVAARSFYAREGFVEIDRRPKYYRHEVDALVLQRELAQ